MRSCRKILIALVATLLVPVAAMAANISVSTVNGQTTVTWNGKKVWTGETTGMVTGKASSINGKEYVVIVCGGGKNGAPSGSSIVAFALPR